MRIIYTLLMLSLLSTAPCTAMAKMEAFFDSKPSWIAPACLIGGCAIADLVIKKIDVSLRHNPKDKFGPLRVKIAQLVGPFIYSPFLFHSTTGLALLYAARNRPEILRTFVETPLKKNPIVALALFGSSLLLSYFPVRF